MSAPVCSAIVIDGIIELTSLFNYFIKNEDYEVSFTDPMLAITYFKET